MVVCRFAVGQPAWAVEAKLGEPQDVRHTPIENFRAMSLLNHLPSTLEKARWTLPPTWPIL
jgi:hypothetical protein